MSRHILAVAAVVLLVVGCAAPNPFPDGYETTLDRSIQIGEGNGDTLDVLFTAHNWRFQGDAGQTVRILVRSDGVSDPRFTLYDADLGVIAADDDGGEGLNAEATVTLPTSGEYILRVDMNAPGRYSLRIDDEE
ncbi:MAG: hypothetical protein ACFB51_03230 [Anaerolineae bacterium]